MQRTIQTLILTHDPGLVSEFTAATDDVGDDVRFVLHVEEDERRAIRHATERPVDLLLVELEQDIRQAKRLAEEHYSKEEHAPKDGYKGCATYVD